MIKRDESKTSNVSSVTFSDSLRLPAAPEHSLRWDSGKFLDHEEPLDR